LVSSWGCCFNLIGFFVHILSLIISPCVSYVVIIWGCWCFQGNERVSWNSVSSSVFSLSKSIISTVSLSLGFSSPFSWVVFFILCISPSVDSVVVVWDGWGLCKTLSFLGGNVVSTLSNFSGLGLPFRSVSFIMLWLSPSVHSIVVISNSWGGSLHKSIISTVSLSLGFSSPFSWVVFFVLCISPSVDSVVVVWNSWGLSKLIS